VIKLQRAVGPDGEEIKLTPTALKVVVVVVGVF
jgi:hypothetical protein